MNREVCWKKILGIHSKRDVILRPQKIRRLSMDHLGCGLIRRFRDLMETGHAMNIRALILCFAQTDQKASPTPTPQVQLFLPLAKSTRRLTWYLRLSSYLGPPPTSGRKLLTLKN
jgi:hypothetical protein